MKIISHRGNIRGPVPGQENRPSYIDCAILGGTQVEVDIRFINDEFWLGHDTPDYLISPKWIEKRIDSLWFHCKNIEAAQHLNGIHSNVKYFCHTSESYVSTNTGLIWVHDMSLPLNEKCIVPLLKESDIITYNDKLVHAVCTDYVKLCQYDLASKGLYA